MISKIQKQCEEIVEEKQIRFSVTLLTYPQAFFGAAFENIFVCELTQEYLRLVKQSEDLEEKKRK